LLFQQTLSQHFLSPIWGLSPTDGGNIQNIFGAISPIHRDTSNILSIFNQVRSFVFHFQFQRQTCAVKVIRLRTNKTLFRALI
ncbi:hypothetical protein PENTCL1PPCAC_28988, partial [Pristionchus entomophagus]